MIDKVGIVSCGSYVPYLRLGRDIIAKAWGRRSPSGEKAAANYDEDALTMAVEACLTAIGVRDPGTMDGLIFSSTTSPYHEKLSSATIAFACDLRKDIISMDVTSTLRSGTSAFRIACELIKGGAAKNILIAASDVRLARPESEMEMIFGDGAGALSLGHGDEVIAEAVGGFSVVDEFLDTWRKEGDRYVQAGIEERFNQIYGYVKNMREACLGAMKAAGVKPEDITSAVLPAPSQGGLIQLAKALGLNAEKQIQDPLLSGIGHCGTAQPMLMIADALEKERPGEMILWAGYGDGADAVVLRTTDAIARHTPERRLKSWIASKKNLSTYEKYLKFKNILEDDLSSPQTSPVLAYKEVSQDIRLYGSKCTSCGTVQYPLTQICISCRTRGKLEDVRLSREGKVFTFTKDYLFASPDPPVVMAVVDLDGGGRLFLQMTDCDHEAVAIGMPVEVCFRRFHEGGGFHNYFWKCRPVRGMETS